MPKKILIIFSFFAFLILINGCGAIGISTNFPSPDDVFITTGDGDIQKPYTPIGQLIYVHQGYRINFLPLFGLIPVDDVDVDYELKTAIFKKVRSMGGDALINMKINWEPPSNGFLGLLANGGYLFVTGTVIKR